MKSVNKGHEEIACCFVVRLTKFMLTRSFLSTLTTRCHQKNPRIILLYALRFWE